MRSTALACALLALPALAVGQTYSPPDFVVDTESLLELSAHKGSAVQLGPFESNLKDDSQVACRGMGPIRMANGQTISGYVHDAFQLQLNSAGLVNATSPTTVTGRLESMDFGWGLPLQGKAKWTMTVVLNSSNGRTLRIASTTEFEGGMNAILFCQNAPGFFMINVQALVRKAITSPEFIALLN